MLNTFFASSNGSNPSFNSAFAVISVLFPTTKFNLLLSNFTFHSGVSTVFPSSLGSSSFCPSSLGVVPSSSPGVVSPSPPGVVPSSSPGVVSSEPFTLTLNVNGSVLFLSSCIVTLNVVVPSFNPLTFIVAIVPEREKASPSVVSILAIVSSAITHSVVNLFLLSLNYI